MNGASILVAAESCGSRFPLQVFLQRSRSFSTRQKLLSFVARRSALPNGGDSRKPESKTITREREFRNRNRDVKKKTGPWVPVAYRGVRVKTPRDNANDLLHQQKLLERPGPLDPFWRRRIPFHKLPASEQKKVLSEDLFKHCQRLERKLDQYKKALLGKPAVEATVFQSSIKDVSLIQLDHLLRQELQSVHKLVLPPSIEPLQKSGQEAQTETTNDVEQAKPVVALVHWEHLMATEVLFREICELLQSLVSVASKCLDWDYEPGLTSYPQDSPNRKPSPSIAKNTFVPIDLALLALQSLQRLGQERKSLVEMCHYQLKQEEEEEEALSQKSNTDNNNNNNNNSAKPSRGWFSRIVGKFFLTAAAPDEKPATNDTPKTVSPPPPQVPTTFVHDEARVVGVNLELYSAILDPLLSPRSALQTGESPYQGVAKFTEKARDYRMQATHRFIEILETMPNSEDYILNLSNVRKHEIVSRLCLSGTLEGALLTRRFYESIQGTLPAIQLEQLGQPEILAWTAYVNTAKNPNCSIEERKESVRQLFDRWLYRWNNNYPSDMKERTEHALLCFSALSALGDGEGGELDEEFHRSVDAVLRRFLGREPYAKYRMDVEASPPDPRRLMFGRDVAVFNALAQVYSCFDVAKSRLLIEAILTCQEGRFLTVETINTYFRGLFIQFTRPGKIGSETIDVNHKQKNVEFVMSLLRLSSMTSKSLDNRPCLATPETFERVGKLLTVLNPGHAGEHYLVWLSLYEIFGTLNGSNTITISDYNRVLWALWQEAAAQAPEDQDNRLNCCEKAWHVLAKLDAMSTPLLLSQKEIRQVGMVRVAPYEVHLQPNRISYEMVLNAALEETKVPSQYEICAQTVLKVLALAKQNNIELNRDLVQQCIRQCKSIIESDSPLALELDAISVYK